MNVALWIVAGLLAAVFLTASSTKLFIPKEKLVGFPHAEWVGLFRAGAVKAIGGVEVLVAVGLVLPAAIGVAPVLVPFAALGAVLLMVGAVVVRVRLGEGRIILLDLTYLVLAAFVVWGRFGPESFTV